VKTNKHFTNLIHCYAMSGCLKRAGFMTNNKAARECSAQPLYAGRIVPLVAWFRSALDLDLMAGRSFWWFEIIDHLGCVTEIGVATMNRRKEIDERTQT
jgi:hypothetical protein